MAFYIGYLSAESLWLSCLGRNDACGIGRPL